MDMVLTSIIITLVMGLFFIMFEKEITELCKKIRSKPFESFVVVSLFIVMALLYKGTFL